MNSIEKNTTKVNSIVAMLTLFLLSISFPAWAATIIAY